MQAGEVRSLRYLTKFRYPSRPDPCFRRGTYKRVDRSRSGSNFIPHVSHSSSGGADDTI
jgi:hypothetical protein